MTDLPTPRPSFEYFFDFSSPWSYLADTQVDRFAQAHDATVVRRPILLGGVFKAIGGPVAPIQTFSANKRSYVLQDLLRFAKWWGEPFQWPTRFPMLTVLPLRVACQLDLADPAARAFCAAVFRAYWVEDQDISTPDTVSACLHAAGLDPGPLVEGAADPVIKQRLVANTEEAVTRGVFGAPSFFVGDELFWGQDRLDHVARALDAARARSRA